MIERLRRATVLIAVQDTLGKLPRAYAKELYNEKCQAVYQHVIRRVRGGGMGYVWGVVGGLRFGQT